MEELSFDEINGSSRFLFYNGVDGKIHVQVIIGDETVWMTQAGMADVFGIDRTGITKHIQNIYETGELQRDTTSAKNALVQKEGDREVTRSVDFYNLDVIIAVGYRVNSYQATQFRIWATRILREYLIKGFALDDERLKQGNNLFNKDFFKELLDRIREIRASEKMFYEKIRDLYATSVDYDKNAPETIAFFAKIQNKLEYAIVGQTAAEIIKTRANSELPNMNLKTFKNAKRGGDIQKADVTVAKNYLEEKEIRELNTLVTMFLDYAELQAERNKLMKMKDWIQRVDAFLRFNEYSVLENAGSIRKDVADNFAHTEYAKYKIIQDKDQTAEFKKALDIMKSTGRLPTESTHTANTKKNELTDFDKQLKGLLSVPPPKKSK
ncbi:virulence RhuM family protein [Ferruginibacter profundus]